MRACARSTTRSSPPSPRSTPFPPSAARRPTRASSLRDLFGFTQFEFGFLLGPRDGRFVVRDRPDGDPGAVLVLSTLAAPERRGLRGRRGRAVREASPEPVPTSRATVVAAAPFEDEPAAVGWLAEIREDGARLDAELSRASQVLNRALHAHRVAAGDAYARDVGPRQALVVRVGIGTGDDAVEGRYADAWELPRDGERWAKRSMEAPDERFAAVLGAREAVLACEELVLRARLDIDGGRPREAALQARIALEALLAELPRAIGDRRGPLEADRSAIGAAANAALRGELPIDAADDVGACVERMEAALRVRRLGSAR